METKKQNLLFGVGFLVLGIALAVTADPWFLGLAFLILGGQRIFVALQMDDDPAE